MTKAYRAVRGGVSLAPYADCGAARLGGVPQPIVTDDSLVSSVQVVQIIVSGADRFLPLQRANMAVQEGIVGPPTMPLDIQEPPEIVGWPGDRPSRPVAVRKPTVVTKIVVRAILA